MARLRALLASPLAILLCLVLGSLTGLLLPALAESAFLPGQLYLQLVSAAALPLLVVATFFGLRQTLALPMPLLRLLTVLLFSFALLLLSAAAGALIGVASGTGQNLDAQNRAYLGSLVQNSESNSADDVMDLAAPTGEQAEPARAAWRAWIPDNFFRVLQQGQSLGILSCAILFGLAFAAITRGTAHNSLMLSFEGIYRALEVVISGANVLIPLLVFGMAAHFFALTDAHTVVAMGTFLRCFIGASLLLCALAALVIVRNSDLPWVQALDSLKTPALISLTSTNASAAIPDTIRALSARMGYSRAIVELLVPAASVFVRAGSALYFGVLGVFVAHLYGRDLGLVELALIALGAVLAALVSAGRSGFVVVGAGSVVLSQLSLPTEAALALFLAVDLLCEGPRNLLSMLAGCVLIVLVCRGLPSERFEGRPLHDSDAHAPLRLSFSRSGLAFALAVFALLLGLSLAAGISVGVGKQHLLQGPAYGGISAGNLGDNPPTSK